MNNSNKWWKHGVVYHLYVRSFYDSNNDGVGDIRGVIQKLDYLKELGVDAIWLSPIFKSPQNDFGYDIEAYRTIEPDFGSEEDFIELLQTAHRMGLKIILDMVLNHTSDKHPWFIESRSSLDSPKRDWYIWKKKRGGRLPNNWMTSFGGKAWCLDRTTNEYYYHSFFKEQPDLNWRNDEVKRAMFRKMTYWLDLGVDGFRLDVINYVAKDKHFRDNPNLFQQLFLKKKVYSRNRGKSIAIVKSLRKLLDIYDDKVSIGEVYTLPPGDSKLVSKYLGNGKDALHLAFDFSLMFTSWSVRNYTKTLQTTFNKIPKKGWATMVMSNHDIIRSYSKHFFYKTEKAKLMALLSLTAYGTPFIYYGDEIGMSATTVPRHLMQDRVGKKYWPFYTGRDKLRTPMQWNDAPFAGFSSVKPWLPVNRKFTTVNVEMQSNAPNSLLALYKNLIAIRKHFSVFQKGNWKIIDIENSNILAYKRVFKKNRAVVLLNFSWRNQEFKVPKLELLFSTHTNCHASVLSPFEGRIFINSASKT